MDRLTDFGTPALAANGLAHRYGDTMALDGVTFEVGEGAFTALLGPNGSGKTTLLRIVSTLLKPTAGTAAVLGHDVQADPQAVRRSLGVVFQSPALDKLLTVDETLRVQAALYGMSRPEAPARVVELLGAFGLSDVAGRQTRHLSGGQRRRVDLARGLVHRPRLLLLDEPTTALDPAARAAFWQTVYALRRDEGIAVLAATHLLDEAEAADHVVILDRGRVVADGAPGALRAALGEETLWLDVDDAEAVAAAFAPDAEAVSPTLVRVLGAAPHRRVEEAYARFGASVRSATVRRASLEDVFLSATGRSLREHEAS
ncbi:MAG: ABC transporter ATP-binding protein [Bacteroidetes bacterium]|nr:ABC transporter ATP-binding protein [Bacteroidota bacterium]